ncbi:hypothetical protein GGI12_005696, partial [Dipsacomyces acuminosporus]
HILDALQIKLNASPDTVKSYYAELKKGLEMLGVPQNGRVPNPDVARILVPMLSRYKDALPRESLSPSNPLYSALDIEQPQELMHGAVIQTFGSTRSKTGSLSMISLHSAVDNARQLQPILNRDLLELVCPPPRSRRAESNRNGRTARYYDSMFNADSSSDTSGSDDSDSDSGSHSDAHLDSDAASDAASDAGADVERNAGSAKPNLDANEMPGSSDEICRHALRILARNSPLEKRSCSVYDTLLYLNKPGRKQVGRAVKFLSASLHAHPESVRIWDLYLELYIRQNANNNEAISAFTDATKFHQDSPPIWSRYAQWCGWMVKSSLPSLTDCMSWHTRLCMVTAMAVKCLAGDCTALLPEDKSAAIAELVVYYFECTWHAFDFLYSKQPDAVGTLYAKLVPAKDQLISCMVACLESKTVQRLCVEITNTRILNDQAKPLSLSQPITAGNSEWALSRILLPHHLLFVVQVVGHCTMKKAFVPRTVLQGMYAALHLDIEYQSTYFFSLANAANSELSESSKPALDPSAIRRGYNL